MDSQKITDAKGNEITQLDNMSFPSLATTPSIQTEFYWINTGIIRFKQIGMAKVRTMKSGNFYYMLPRARGLEIIDISADFQCQAFKLDALVHPSFLNGQEMAKIGELSGDGETIENLKLGLRNRDREWLRTKVIQSLAEVSHTTVLEAQMLIEESKGSITIKNIYELLSISKSTLEHQFLKSLGMTPKEYCRVVRLNHFIETYRGGFEESLTETTYRCGYYDQSHLIKEFRYFLNSTPSRYFRLAG